MPEILSPGAREFVSVLHREFAPRRRELLEARSERQGRIAAGELPDFLAETRDRARSAGRGACPRRLPTSRTAAARSPARSTGR